VEVGAPSGRAKTILVDLTGKLPPRARRLRVTTGFEIYWDRIALFERGEKAGRTTLLTATAADLHHRGYSKLHRLADTAMLVPEYEEVESTPLWRITPSGWATRYGAVDELIVSRDNALVAVAGGDELTLEFAADNLPTKGSRMERDFFLWVSGWDKDSDFHVVTGTSIEPWPWHGLDDQNYGRQMRPAFTNDTWIPKYNTRWIGERILSRH
jgi:hypothetical protein